MLDNNSSQTSVCEQLCVNQDEKGCCYLDQLNGCYWYGGGRVAVDGTSALAVDCSSAGRFLKILGIKMTYSTR